MIILRVNVTKYAIAILISRLVVLQPRVKAEKLNDLEKLNLT